MRDLSDLTIRRRAWRSYWLHCASAGAVTAIFFMLGWTGWGWAMLGVTGLTLAFGAVAIAATPTDELEA